MNFWEDNAKAWNEVMESRAIASRPITNEALLNALKTHGISSILDIGCGEGWLSAALPDSNYFGVDGSSALIEIARKKHPTKKFATATFAEMLGGVWKPDEKYSAIVLNFCLLEENISPLLQIFSTYLEKDERIFLQTLHPCFALKEYKDSWQQEDFKTMSVPFTGTMPWFGRTLSSWSDAISSAGLVLQKIEEPLYQEKPCSILFSMSK